MARKQGLLVHLLVYTTGTVAAPPCGEDSSATLALCGVPLPGILGIVVFSLLRLSCRLQPFRLLHRTWT